MKQTGIFYVVYSTAYEAFLTADMNWDKQLENCLHISTPEQAADYVESSDEVVLPVSFTYVVG